MEKIKKPNFFVSIYNFIKSSIEELKKVNWPSGEEVQNMTSIVVFFIIIIALLLSIADVVSVKLVDWIFSL